MKRNREYPKVWMPKKLTADNGAKSLVIGEFHEILTIPNPNYCDSNPNEPEEIQIKVPVSWTTIKSIYETLVENFSHDPH